MTGRIPSTCETRKSATTEDVMTEIMSGAVNSLWISSMAKRTPVRGAWNAADMPAAAPQVTRRRSSPLLRPRTRETALPDMPPSWTEGPSRPMERPAKVSSVPSQNLARTTRCQGMSMRPMTSASTCGMPLPEVAGSQCMSARTTSSMTRSASIQATMRATLPVAAPVICLRRRSAADSDRR